MASVNPIPQARPNGAAWAALLAAGIGCASLGLFIDLAEAFKSVSNALNFYNPSGDLTGKTILAIAIWGIAWGVLHAIWKNRNIRSTGKITLLTVVLILLGFLVSFPPFFELFAAK